MSDEDREVTARSNKDCRTIAVQTKKYYQTERRWPVNILKIVQSGKVLTIHGEKPLVYEVVGDILMADVDGSTTIEGGIVKIRVKRSVHQQAAWGVGRARMTLAHELGHAVMHAAEGISDNRSSGATGKTHVSTVRPARSAERQAKVFASAFLIDDQRALELNSPTEISAEFIVSLEAAEVCFERLQTELERVESAKRVIRLSEEFLTRDPPSMKQLKHLDIECVSCGHNTLVPVGVKVVCSTCSYLGDHPQSGDPAP